MQVNRRVSFEELTYLSRFLYRKIVGDHVDLLAARLVHDQVGQESYELSRGVPCHHLDEHFARLGVERGIQRSMS